MKQIVLSGCISIILIASCNMKGNNAASYYNQGVSRERLKDYRGALAYYTQSIQSDSNAAGVYLSRANIKILLNDSAGAAADCSKALTIAPTLMNKVAIIMSRGAKEPVADAANSTDNEMTMSEDDLKKDINSKKAGDYINKARKEEYENDLKDAIKDYSKAIELTPDDTRIYMNRSRLEFRLKNKSGAMADLDKAIEIDPTLKDAYLGRGFIKQSEQQYKNAIIDFTVAISLDNNYAAAYLYRGISYHYLNNNENSCADLYKAAALGDTSAPGLISEACK